MKGYFKVSELLGEVTQKYEEGISKGEDVGFKCLKEKYSVKLGVQPMYTDRLFPVSLSFGLKY